MLKTLSTLVLAAAIATPVAAVQDAWETQVNEYLDEAGEAIAVLYVPTGYQKSGSLSQGENDYVAVNIPSSGNYAIVAVCDDDCSDLDLTVLGSDGGELGSDFEDDDVPVVKFGATAAGAIRVMPSMAACGDEPCRYGFRLYRER